MRVQRPARSFALCIDDGGMEDLEARKVYQVLPDPEARREGHLRVIDESGEDYIYPADLFLLLKLPSSVTKRLRSHVKASRPAARRAMRRAG